MVPIPFFRVSFLVLWSPFVVLFRWSRGSVLGLLLLMLLDLWLMGLVLLLLYLRLLPLLFLSLFLRLPGLLFLLLLPLLLMLLNLGPLLILTLSFLSHLLSLLPGLGRIILNVPSFLLFPVSVTLPGLPVPLKLRIWDLLIVPSVTLPIVVMVVSSPMGVHVIIESRDPTVIDPTAIIIVRTIPAAPVWSPPPAIPEEQVHLYVRDNVNGIGVRQYDDFRRPGKYDRWQRDTNTDTYLCPRCHSKGTQKHNQDCSDK